MTEFTEPESTLGERVEYTSAAFAADPLLAVRQSTRQLKHALTAGVDALIHDLSEAKSRETDPDKKRGLHDIEGLLLQAQSNLQFAIDYASVREIYADKWLTDINRALTLLSKKVGVPWP